MLLCNIKTIINLFVCNSDFRHGFCEWRTKEEYKKLKKVLFFWSLNRFWSHIIFIAISHGKATTIYKKTRRWFHTEKNARFQNVNVWNRQIYVRHILAKWLLEKKLNHIRIGWIFLCLIFTQETSTAKVKDMRFAQCNT